MTQAFVIVMKLSECMHLFMHTYDKLICLPSTDPGKFICLLDSLLMSATLSGGMHKSRQCHVASPICTRVVMAQPVIENICQVPVPPKLWFKKGRTWSF
ncbi:TPA: hypothetical protein ACH3X3_000348 [Trebouxia sp. C0006]